MGSILMKNGCSTFHMQTINLTGETDFSDFMITFECIITDLDTEHVFNHSGLAAVVVYLGNIQVLRFSLKAPETLGNTLFSHMPLHSI